MKHEEIVVGARIRCIFTSTDTPQYYGKLGTITKAPTSKGGIYWTKFDNEDFEWSWGSPDSCELLVAKTHYTVKGISQTYQPPYTYPTDRGHETWISAFDSCYKEAEKRARYQDINHAHVAAALYNHNNRQNNDWQFIVEETD